MSGWEDDLDHLDQGRAPVRRLRPAEQPAGDAFSTTGDRTADQFSAAPLNAAQISYVPSGDWSEIQHDAPANPTLSDEVTFISGLNPDGTLALYSFAAWNGDNPASYGGGFTPAKKWFADANAGTAGTPGGTVKYYFDNANTPAWSADEKAAFVTSLSLWSALANISFVETFDASPSNSKIIIKRGTDGGAHANTTGTTPSGGGVTGGTKLLQITGSTVSIDTTVTGFGPISGPASPNAFSNYGGYPWQTMLHELGHALGLGHAGPYPASDGTHPNSLQYSAYDSTLYTIMSYIDPSPRPAGFPAVPPPTYQSQYSPSGTDWKTVTNNGFIFQRDAVTPMIADILAIQQLYGTPTSTPLNNVTFGANTNIAGPIAAFFNFNSGKNDMPVVTLWATGINTLDLRVKNDNAVVNLNPGTFSSYAGLTNNIGIAYNTRIDTLYTGSGADKITGNNNGNIINSGSGDDIITGGSGNDTIDASDGNDTIDGGDGSDTIYAGDGNDTVMSGNGDDRVTGFGGTNVMDGGAGTDTAVMASLRVNYTVVMNLDGSVTVTGLNSPTRYESSRLTNFEFLAFSDQTLSISEALGGGNAGNDTVFATDADEYLDGGPGIDTISYANLNHGVSVNLSYTLEQTGSGSRDTIKNFEILIGTAYNDVLYGAANTVAINAGGGDDTVEDQGSIGATYDGGAGIDKLTLSRGAATAGIVWTFTPGATSLTFPDGTLVKNFEYIELLTGLGNDTITFNGLAAASSRSSIWDAGAGNDTAVINLSSYATAITTIYDAGSFLYKVQSTSTTFSDLLVSKVENIRITGGSGNDTLSGYGGDDVLEGGIGNDTLNGGTGYDYASYAGAASGVSVNLGVATAQNTGGAGIDTLSNFEGVIGSAFNDILTGDGLANDLQGGDGNDTLEGGAGDDTLNGGTGFDIASYAGAASGVTVDLRVTTAQNTGGAGADTLVGIEGLVGSAYNDVLIGNAEGNRFQGGTGTNQIDGGGGNDTAVYTLNRSAFSIKKNIDGTISVTGSGTGINDTLTSIEILAFADQTVSAASISNAPSDFNGDGKSDILWRSSSNGYAEWVMNGASVTSDVSLGTIGWTPSGIGDFNGDGKADLVWRNGGNNAISIETINGSGFSGLGTTPSRDASYTVAAIGDFDADGKSDILWRSGANAYSAWLMNGAAVKSDVSLGTVGWTLAGSGDFNGDGKTDLVWRNGGNGAISIETVNGSSFGGLGSTPSRDASYTVAAIGDFDADGKADLLWRGSGNAYSVWLMNGAAVKSDVSLGTVGWTLEGSGDYNGDGKADLVWRNGGNGAVSVETINGSSFSGLGATPTRNDSWTFASKTSVLGEQTAATPSVRAVSDFNGDGKSDILWRSSSNGYAEWVMNGASVTSDVSLGTIGWTPSGIGDFNGDGKADLVWRNGGNNAISIETINGSGFSGLGTTPSRDASYTVAAIGDFDADGKSDILWRSGANAYSAWLMNGAAVKSDVSLGTVGWTLAGSGDFNGDGKTDLVWRNGGNGAISIETVNGSSFGGLGSTPSRDASYTVAAIGDFDADGKADLLWRGSGNAYSVWLMNGAAVKSDVSLGTVGWTLEGSGDYNGDGKADLVWRNGGNGAVSVETINGSSFSGLGATPTRNDSWTFASKTSVLAAAS